MYDFAVVALLGLAALKVCDLLEDLLPGLARLSALFTFVIAVAAAVAIDYSLFDGFGISLREDWMGTWATGLIIGSLATVWRAALGWLGLTEHEDTGRSHGRPRMAA